MPSWVTDFLERDPDAAGLRVVRRHRSALHVRERDGSIRAVIAAHPIHYRPGNGSWAAIDTTLQVRQDGRYGAPHTPVVLAADGSVAIAGGAYGHMTRRVGLLNPVTRAFTALRSLPAPRVDGDALVRTVGPFQHVVRLTEDGLREELLISALPGGDTAAWLVVESELSGVTLPDGWVDSEWQADGFVFPLPSATDAGGRVVPCRRFAHTVGGRQLLYTGIAVSVLATAGFPVTLDPDFAGDTTYFGYVGGLDSVYATARGTGSFGAANNGAVGQSSGSSYQIYRLYLRFDTSSIGAGATITSVTMTLTVISDTSNTDFDVQIVKADWSGSIPPQSNKDATYDTILAAALDAVWRNTSGMSLNTQYTSPALATAWVSKTGYTYYGLRSSRDANNTAPTLSEYVSFAPTNHATPSYRPVLTVAYTVPTYAPPPVRRPLRVWPVRR